MDQGHFHDDKESDRNSGSCYLHRKEVFVGVCPLCLNERLLTLASLKQRQNSNNTAQRHRNSGTSRGHSFSLTKKILSLSSLLNLLERANHKTCSDFSDDQDCNSGSTSEEDSFISIKFEENGVAFWDKDKKETTTDINKASGKQQNITKEFNMQLKAHADESSKKHQSNNASDMEKRIRPRGRTYQWRKRIGHVLDSIRWSSGSTYGKHKN